MPIPLACCPEKRTLPSTVSILLSTPTTVKHVAVTSRRATKPVKEMATPIKHESSSSATPAGSHDTSASLAGSAVATAMASISGVDSVLVSVPTRGPIA